MILPKGIAASPKVEPPKGIAASPKNVEQTLKVLAVSLPAALDDWANIMQ